MGGAVAGTSHHLFCEPCLSGVAALAFEKVQPDLCPATSSSTSPPCEIRSPDLRPSRMRSPTVDCVYISVGNLLWGPAEAACPKSAFENQAYCLGNRASACSNGFSRGLSTAKAVTTNVGYYKRALCPDQSLQHHKVTVVRSIEAVINILTVLVFGMPVWTQA